MIIKIYSELKNRHFSHYGFVIIGFDKQKGRK